MGPQGNGFDLKGLGQGARALIIGGGIGVPPLVQVAKQLHEQGVEVHSVLGFANKEAVILEEELKQYGQVTITTDDGSYGTKGYVSTVIDQMDQEFDAIYSCGSNLACSNMSIPNSMTIPAPTFLWNRVWLVGWVLAMPVWCI